MVKVWESSADTSPSSTNCILEKGLSVTDAGTTDNGDAEGKTRKGELNRITLFDIRKMAVRVINQTSTHKYRHNSMFTKHSVGFLFLLQKEFTFTM